MNHRKENDFLNGVPELLILQLLARQPLHGYDLVQAIKLSTGGTLSFGEGSIYPVLHRMVADGILASRDEAVNGRKRVIYSLTTAGTARLQASTSRWESITAAIRAVLSAHPSEAKGGRDGTPVVA
ncbi:MAG: PadR family transcriptional regulator [Gemmataceae bacterium]